VGSPPEVTFEADPVILPVGGGRVTLSWDASDANHLVVFDESTPESPLLDADLCDGPTCVQWRGSLDVLDVGDDTVWTLIATNEFGARRARAGAATLDAPAFLTVSIDGSEVVPPTAFADSVNATLEYATENAQEVELWLAEPDGLACPGSGGWQREGRFEGRPVGSANVDVDDPVCVRLVALGPAEQATELVFLLRRRPEVLEFDALPNFVLTRTPVRLEWQTELADFVILTSDPSGAISEDDKAACTAVNEAGDGSCEIELSSGTSGSVTLSLTAVGEGAVLSLPRETTVTVGLTPVITSFEASPRVISTTRNVVLEWTSIRGESVQVRRGGEVVFESEEPAVAIDGDFTEIAISETTVWTLTVFNEVGTDSKQTQTFASVDITRFDLFDADGVSHDLLSGEALIPTGSATVVIDAGVGNDYEFQIGQVAGGELFDCSGATGWGTLSSGVIPAGAGIEIALADLIGNRCLRVEVCASGSSDCEQVTTPVVERPTINDVATNVESFTLGGGDVEAIEITTKVGGAQTVTASYTIFDITGNPLHSGVACTPHDWNNEPDPATSIEVSMMCRHNLDEICPDCVPTDTGDAPPDWVHDAAFIRYFIVAFDDEDDSWEVSSEAFGADVEIDAVAWVRTGLVPGD